MKDKSKKMGDDSKKSSLPTREGYVLVGFTPYRKTKSGRRIYASSYGLKAFPIWRKVKE